MSDDKTLDEIRDLAKKLGIDLNELATVPPVPPAPNPNDIVPGTVPNETVYRVSWRNKGQPAKERGNSIDFARLSDADAYAAKLRTDTAVEPGSVAQEMIDSTGWV